MRKALAARPDRRRFVCASAGNHAQGMAYRLPAFRRRGRRLHAGDDAAAEDRQDPGSSAAAGSRSAWSATISTRPSPPPRPSPPRPARCSCRRSTTPTSSRARPPSRSRFSRRCRNPTSSSSRSAAAASPPASSRWPRRSPARTAIRLVEPSGAPSLRRALEAGALGHAARGRQLRRRRRRGPDRRPQLRGARRRPRPPRCCSPPRTASARRWSRC